MRKIGGENKSEWFKLAYTTTQSIDAIVTLPAYTHMCCSMDIRSLTTRLQHIFGQMCPYPRHFA